ncbi:pancreatic lipase-related protein 2-like isoform X1 [Schistocerca piceifrons]|uniref:pancreatic lipase-related protein 2-like n=2 Tax=Schistocerca TaxID=7008 RepID=UPI001F5E6B2D|nr:pancreatic lipase-related protein 2-like isoform X1 [Schistocerca piceifrons]XP_049955736.1 pancreatic lipase-related protein 2-like [Schistocerca serialis cubense]
MKLFRRISLLLFLLSCEDGLSRANLSQLGESYRMVRSRIADRRQGRSRARLMRKEVCYDDVGCFAMPKKHSAFMKVPESPESVDTKFWLFTRANTTAQEVIDYGNGSLQSTNFNHSKPLKVLIHGYKGSGRDKGALTGVAALIKKVDANILVVDWQRGAAGPSYATAVANTELVGRQLALLLLHMIQSGIQPSQIHVIGFSLGAHVAACASNILRSHNILLGRITGLDPASPIYKSSLLLQSYRKLDTNDAAYVDIIHTDGSRTWAEGFGLLRPLGHADFYPNGGRTQPGCTEGYAAVVVSHLEGTVNSSTVCSHVRAWSLFLETLNEPNSECQFIAYPCSEGEGLPCFPPKEACKDPSSCAIMGWRAQESQARGALYLVTRDRHPFCGKQLRASVNLADGRLRSHAGLSLIVHHGSSATTFELNSGFADIEEGGRTIWGLAAAEYSSIDPVTTPKLVATLSCSNTARLVDSVPVISVQSVSVADLHGNSWNYCGGEAITVERNDQISEVNFTLVNKNC